MKIWLPAAAALLASALLVASRGDRLSPAQSANLYERSGLLYQQGHYRRAMRRIRRLLRAESGNPLYLRRKAEIQRGLGDFRGEAQTWEQVLKSSRPSDACPDVGRAYDRAGLAEKSFEAYRRCQELDAKNPDTAFFLARELQSRSEHEEAEKKYKQILADYPGYADASLGIARIRLGQNRLGEAQAIVSAVLKKSPDNADALILRALVAERKGDRVLAKDSLLAAARAASAYTDVYRILGRLYDQDGDREGARRAYSKIAELEPGDEKAKRRLKELGQP